MKKKNNIQKNRTQTKSLKAKMLFVFILPFFLVLATTGVIILTNVSSVVVDLNEDLTKQVILARADEIEKYIQGIIYDVKTMSERNVITSGDIATIRNDMETRESTLRSDFVRTLYAELDGSYYSSTGSKGDISDRDYFREIVSEGAEYAISNPVISTATGETVFIVAYGVKDNNGTLKGVFGATILMDTFNDVITSIQIGDSGIPWITDNTGLIIAHPDENIRLTLYATDSNEAGFDGLDEIGANMLAGQSGIDQYGSNGKQYYAVYVPIPSTPGWSLAYSISEAEMMAPVNKLTTMITIIFVACLLLIAALTYIIANGIVKPIKAAAGLANALASGNLNQSITIKTKDEIGQLSQVLDKEVRQAFIQIEHNRQIVEKQNRYQNEQVDKLVVNLERLAKGELYCDMAVTEADADTQEIYTLFKNISDNLHLSIDTIKEYVEDISRILGEMAKGNLAVDIDSEYRGDFVALQDSINGIVASLNEVMLEINTSADQVASGTQQVSSGGQEISQGAAEQASAIEELTASITQITEQTRLNAESANEASQLTNGAKDNAEQGNEQMRAMQQSMADINESSENISKIIKVIDDIAFQTNILALNAAVEAARAGVHGKGFAVVAEEVRNLAAKSADAARQTTDLIEGSVRRAEAGTKIADETAEALTNIVSGVEKAAQLVGEIASASNEQASAIAQVNNGIEQMSQVVQTNSATSEESAAAAEELSSQAEMLKDMVGQFQLKSAKPDEKKTEIKIKAEQDPVQPEKSQGVLNDEDFGKY